MLQYAEYAPDDDERALHLRFVSPTTKRLSRMREKVQIIADQLGQDPPMLELPRKGLLPDDLDTIQRQCLNTVLSFRYAMRNALDQEALRAVPIAENNEPMVSVPDTLSNHGVKASFSERAFHEACGSWAGFQRVYYLRQTVAERLALVGRALWSADIMLHVEDCWRPWQVQKGLFIRRFVQIARDHPEWSLEQVCMVTASLTAPAPGLAGHQAGAAVDARLQFASRPGVFYDLGNDYAEVGIFSSIDSPYITGRQWETRTYFAAAMRMGGFKLLRTENWHASHGDRGMGTDGAVRMRKARFGPLHEFDSSGQVRPYESQWIEGWYLTQDQCAQLLAASREGGGGQFVHSVSYLSSKFLGEAPEHFKKA